MSKGQPQGLNPGYKATIVIFWILVLTSLLWGLSAVLGRCRWLGALHTAYCSSSAAVQRNIPVYILHIVMDTIILVLWFEPVFAGWCGCTESGPTHSWQLGFSTMYIVVAYALELVWRSRVDTMLAVHHVATILIISVLLGELPAQLYQFADAVILLGVFAVLEQPTFVALLLLRVLPEGSIHTVRAWRAAVGFWFSSKTLSLVMALGFIVRDWPLMPSWAKGMYLGIWALVYSIQIWSLFIQLGIMRGVCAKHQKQQHRGQQGLLSDLAPGRLGAAKGKTSWDSGSSVSLIGSSNSSSELQGFGADVSVELCEQWSHGATNKDV